jgi:dTDP-4-dehydrorhamnose reductase
MRIFISGGSGLLGSKIAEIALGKHEIYTGYCHTKPEFGEPVMLDLAKNTDFEVITKINPEVIIHTAALTNVDDCEANKELAYKINIEGTRRIAALATELGAFLVYVSTDYVFSGDRGMYKEDDEPNPIDYYGYTKLLGERYCDCVARPCVIYGAKPASGKVNLALWQIKELKKKHRVKIVTDQYVTPTLNTNLAKMLLEIAERGLKGIFHLSGKERVSRYDFALQIANKFGLDKNLIVPSKMAEMSWIATRPKDSSLDTAKASRCLYEKPYDLDTALTMLKEELEKC